jgi:DNA mismatch repair protein MutS
MNACGKTSLIKACGLSVLLAQIGSFVPASSYEFSPFKQIMTRIKNEDSVINGKSSFVSEMMELRNILNRAGSNTLVLADEITRGTEHISGSSIFASSVITLARRKVNFMFTTHLHNIYRFIMDIENVNIFHLSVLFEDGFLSFSERKRIMFPGRPGLTGDPNKEEMNKSQDDSYRIGSDERNIKRIVFERKLKEGPGESIYGLEVCNYLNMDTNFLNMAFDIRKEIVKEENKLNKSNEERSILFQSCKTSRYNSNKKINNCEICGYIPKDDISIPLDTHHIEPKGKRKDSGFLNINAKFNLVALCKECHKKVHKKEISINGYKSTSEGVILDFMRL